ncbi:hypothetical protein HGRIS_005236 [Hohenbuehelia grisea]|uniref:Yeast cell wall synthesis Kre9/Knh1-like N-terminal domain-containing protein n=1 Tax=Hohenbuehelia grisea TaxID=104357 RepID=A0ABR3JF41_9AGAR
MFSHSFSTVFALLAASSALVARADPTPSEPGPGDVFRQGAQCHIAWAGDADSTETWKEMSIQLMTGDNFNMIHLTTVTTVDGTKDGVFDWPCPEVEPNSAVYFYQFTSPATPNKTWATRFTIASASGQTTPPENPTQPGTNAPIPWGVGKLVDPSKATPPPPGAGGSSGASGSAGPSGLPLSSVSVTSGPSASSAPSATASLPTLSQTPSSRLVTSVSSSQPTSTPAASQTPGAASSNSNSALGGLIIDSRMWQAAVVFGASTLAFTILL